MDCSLSTWPSMNQFDDFPWMGFADIDPLENLDRNFDYDFRFNEISFSNLQEAKPSLPATTTMPCNDTPPQILHTQSGDFYRLTSSESLAAERWESMNGAELASVLDTLPPNEDTSTTAEDMYDLYNDGILMQPEPQLAGDVDAFMSEVTEANTTILSNDNIVMNVSLMTPDVSSLTSTQEDVKCEGSVGDDDSSASINVSQTGMHKPRPSRGGCNTEHMNMLESGGRLRVNRAQPSNCYPFTPMKLPVCGDPCSSSHCALNLNSHRQDCPQPGMIMQWPKAQSTSENSQIFDREKVVHHSNLHIGDSYPATLHQQVRLADAARVTSELKRNRAQASRARRLAASQRRAKKYPLQKLIRMSSSPSSTRDRLDQNLANSAAMVHPPLQMVSQNQFPGQPLSRNVLNSQVPSFLPVVLQGPNLAASHELVSHTNPVQGVPFYCYQNHPSVTLDEDNRVSSGNSTVQSTCSEQDVQSLSTAALSHSTNSSQILDAAMLEQLQSILSKMTVDMRLCIRDALYRLARSAKHRQRRTDNASASDSSSSHSEEAMETNTNSIDRWIVNILFCKQPAAFEANSQSYPAILSQAPDQSIESANMNSLVQQWNSCGSSVNLQDRPLHVVTGL